MTARTNCTRQIGRKSRRIIQVEYNTAAITVATVKAAEPIKRSNISEDREGICTGGSPANSAVHCGSPNHCERRRNDDNPK